MARSPSIPLTERGTPGSPARALPWLLLVYAAASLLHFAHNAELLAEYPNLPSWLTRGQVYAAWVCVTATGLVGYLLYRTGGVWSGLALLAVYAALGLDGLLHYSRAPVAAHSPAMNLTIWFEAIAATLTLFAIGGATMAAVRARRAARLTKT
jgi:hypothetical protein